MTTVTLTDRRIDRQHSRARQSPRAGCYTARIVERMGDRRGVGELEKCVALKRLDVAGMCIVVFVWARFLL